MIAIANLCTCNNCEGIFIDQNPQIGAPVYRVNVNKTSDLQFNSNESCWVCPVCDVDDYLTDDVNEKKAKKLGIIN